MHGVNWCLDIHEVKAAARVIRGAQSRGRETHALSQVFRKIEGSHPLHESKRDYPDDNPLSMRSFTFTKFDSFFDSFDSSIHLT
jgi:hypothetical protein